MRRVGFFADEEYEEEEIEELAPIYTTEVLDDLVSARLKA